MQVSTNSPGREAARTVTCPRTRTRSSPTRPSPSPWPPPPDSIRNDSYRNISRRPNTRRDTGAAPVLLHRQLYVYSLEDEKRDKLQGSEVDEAELRSVSRLASPPPQPPTLQSVLPAAAVSGWIENQMSLLNNVLMQIPRTPILLPTADQAARVLRQTTIDGSCPPRPPSISAIFRRLWPVENSHPLASKPFGNGRVPSTADRSQLCKRCLRL